MEKSNAPDPQELAAIRTSFIHQQELSPEDVNVLFVWINRLEADLAAVRAQLEEVRSHDAVHYQTLQHVVPELVETRAALTALRKENKELKEKLGANWNE